MVASESYEVPRGYTGWVFLGYGVPTCAPLPEVEGQRVARVPASGTVCTRSEAPTGWVRRTFYEGTGAERTTVRQSGGPDERRIWSFMSGEGGVTSYRTAAFFVGTWAEHEARLAELERLGAIPWGAAP